MCVYGGGGEGGGGGHVTVCHLHFLFPTVYITVLFVVHDVTQSIIIALSDSAFPCSFLFIIYFFPLTQVIPESTNSLMSLQKLQ